MTLDMMYQMTYTYIIMNKRTQDTKMDTDAQQGQIADESVFVTVDKVAKTIGFTSRTIRRMMEDKILPGRKFGSEWRMHRDDFAKLTKPQLTDAA